jgi:hypothetical protein
MCEMTVPDMLNFGFSLRGLRKLIMHINLHAKKLAFWAVILEGKNGFIIKQ